MGGDSPAHNHSEHLLIVCRRAATLNPPDERKSKVESLYPETMRSASVPNPKMAG